MSAGWLVRDSAGALLRLADGEALPLVGVPARPGLPVEAVSYAQGPPDLLLVDDPGGPRAWISPDGLRWTLLPSPPDGVRWEERGLFPRPGVVAFVQEGRAWVGSAEGWEALELPEGARWIGHGRADWWAVGRRPATRVRNADWEPAAWRRVAGRWSPLELRLSWWSAVKALRWGAFGSFRGIEASGEPLVLAAESAWFLDDPSWTLFTRGEDGRFRVTRLGPAPLVGLDRDAEGHPLATTADGELWRHREGRWRASGVAGPLGKALDGEGVPRRRTVYLSGSGDRLRCVVHWWPDGERTRTLGLGSDDGGQTWFPAPAEGLAVVAAWA